jgi:hypothetical protein
LPAQSQFAALLSDFKQFAALLSDSRRVVLQRGMCRMQQRVGKLCTSLSPAAARKLDKAQGHL